MARRRYFVPGSITGAIAIVLLILATVSIPLTTHKSSPFDIVRAYRLDGNVIDVTPGTDNRTPLQRIKWGKWGYCTQPIDSDYYSECTNPLRYDYTQVLTTPAAASAAGDGDYNVATIDRSWTRGLVTGAVALGVSIIAFALSFIPSLAVDAIAAVAYLCASTITFVAFWLDLVIYLKARAVTRQVYGGAHVMPGPSFYFDLIAIPLLFFSSLIVCIGAIRGRKERKDEALYQEKIGSRTASEAPHSPAVPATTA